MKFKLNQKVKTDKGEGVIVKVDKSDDIEPYYVQFLSGERFWFKESDLELIPPTLQERWDSGERFRSKITKAEVKELHVFKSGRVAIDYRVGYYSIYDNEEDFFEHYEPIPSEPKTRWVNVLIADCGVTTYTVAFGEKNELANISVQQQLINGKWVNV